MNSFGRLFRVSILGESHGPCVGIVVDGCPAGLPLSPADFAPDLQRRMGGRPGTTARKEADIPSIMSGLFEGRTTGAPVAILFENRDAEPGAYEPFRKTPRPGQADFVAFHKYGGFNDFRGEARSPGA